MSVNIASCSLEGMNPANAPCGNVRPPEGNIVPQSELDSGVLYDEHIKFKHLTEMSLTNGEIYLFGELKRILVMIADNKIPEDDDRLRSELRTLKKVDDLINKKREIPLEILEIYRARRNEIEHSMKAYVKKKYGGYDNKIDLPPDKKPALGIAYICKKAKLALIFV